jgi:eukaryotic-like serine/threonine-protein kinase
VSLAGGTKVDHYEIVAPIGAGGMGEVYRAHDERLARDVAIKVLPAAVRADPQRLKRFEHEARATGGLNHPGIVSVFDVGEHDGAPYLVIELLDGATLRERLRNGPLPVRKAVEYAIQIAQALAAAHDAGIVHRDLKPDNLFVTRDGRVKILDFGLAKAIEDSPARDGTLTADRTDSGAVLGTAGYMAPEQVRGKDVDHRADLFALGVVLHEMLTGAAPFARPTPIERALATLNEDPPPLPARDISPALDAIVRRCVEKSVEERFQSARDLAFALGALATTTGSGASALKVQAPPSHVPKLVLVFAAIALAGSAGFLLRGQTLREVVSSAAPTKPPTFQRIAFRPGIIKRARFAPDGHTIVFGARFMGDTLHVYSAIPGGLEPRLLYERAMELVDVSAKTGELALALQDPLALARAPLAGGEPRALVDGFSFTWRGRGDASWAPDGETLLVQRLIDNKTHIEYPPGHVLIDDRRTISSARVSPDGSMVAFMTSEHLNEYDRIEVVDRSGHRRVIVGPLRAITSLAWTPDGREIWFSDGPRLRAVSVDSGAQRTLVECPGDITIEDVRRDGSALVISDYSSAHLVAHTPGDTVVRELSWQNGGYLSGLTDDGKLVAIGEYALATKSEAYIRSTDGKPAVHLGPGQPQGLSSDGKLMLVVDNFPAHELSVVPTSAGQSRRVAFGSIVEISDAGLFHDGHRILIAGNEAGRPGRMWIADLASSASPRPITAEGVTAVFDTPTLDDKHMLGLDATGALALLPIDGGVAKPLVGLENSAPLAWGADGHSLYILHRSKGSPTIVQYDFATRTSTTRVRLDGYDLTHNLSINNVAITPDGATYAFDYVERSSQLYLVEGLH